MVGSRGVCGCPPCSLYTLGQLCRSLYLISTRFLVIVGSLCFFGRLRLRQKEGVTRIPESKRMRCTASRAFDTRHRLLFRENEHTRREGSRHRRAVHIHGCGPQTGTVRRYAPVPNEGAVPIAPRVEEHCAPSAHATRHHPQRSHASMPVCARRRSTWCR